MSLPCLTPVSSDFRGYPPEQVYTFTKTQSFQRNNCSGGDTGSWVEYSKTYTSYVSPLHLEFLIESDRSNYETEGQNYANENGECDSTCPTYLRGDSNLIVSMNATSVWKRSPSRPNSLTVRSRSNFDSGTPDPTNQPTLHNADVNETYWPHDNADHLWITFIPDSTTFNVLYVTPSNGRCSLPSLLYSGLTLGGDTTIRGIAVLRPSSGVKGVIYAVCPSPQLCDIYFYSDAGYSRKLGTVTAPTVSNGRYYWHLPGPYPTLPIAISISPNQDIQIGLTSHRIDAFLWSPDRTRRFLIQLTRDSNGEYVGFNYVINGEYSGNGFTFKQGSWCNENHLFVISEDRNSSNVENYLWPAANAPTPPAFGAETSLTLFYDYSGSGRTYMLAAGGGSTNGWYWTTGSSWTKI